MAICPAGPCSRRARLDAEAKLVVALYVVLTGLPYSDLVVRRHDWTCEGDGRHGVG